MRHAFGGISNYFLITFRPFLRDAQRDMTARDFREIVLNSKDHQKVTNKKISCRNLSYQKIQKWRIKTLINEFHEFVR